MAPSAVRCRPAENGRIDIALRKTKDLAAQLSNTEWFTSMPGTAEQKRPLIECMSCHTFERIARTRYGADEMYSVLKRMTTYANNSTMQRVQQRKVDRRFDEESFRKLAAYLASVNLSKGPSWSYELKTLPRPTAGATRVVITEYDLPRKTIAPHDVRTDADGMVWYSNSWRIIWAGSIPGPAATRSMPIRSSSPGLLWVRLPWSPTTKAIFGWLRCSRPAS